MLEWNEQDEPISRKYGDRYFSSGDGLQEKRAVFLETNEIPSRFKSLELNSFTVGELGFGTGLGFVLTAQEWLKSGKNKEWKRLIYLAVEESPVSRRDLDRIWESFVSKDPSLKVVYESLDPHAWPRVPGYQIRLYPELGIELRLWVGDGEEGLKNLRTPHDSALGVNAWFFDGFSPALNESLWSPTLFKEVTRLSAPDATFGTYTASSKVRDSLASAGFDIRKVEGFGRKKHRLKGCLPKRETENFRKISEVHIVGGGIAGATLAFSLARRGIPSTIWEKEKELAKHASGNPLSLLTPPLHTRRDFRARFHWAGFGLTRALFSRWKSMGTSIQGELGAVKMSVSMEEEAKLIGSLGHACHDEWKDSHFLRSGWITMSSWILALLVHRNVYTLVTLRLGETISSIHDLLKNQGAHVVIATGAQCDFPELKKIPVMGARGQLAFFREKEGNTKDSTIAYDAERFWVPGQGIGGASFKRNDMDTEIRAEENKEIWEQLASEIPGFKERVPFDEQDFTKGRVGFRPVTNDAFPNIGAVTNESDNRIWAFLGLASRGLTGSLIGAEHLASLMTGELPVVEMETEKNLDPKRHEGRELKKDPKDRNDWWRSIEAHL